MSGARSYRSASVRGWVRSSACHYKMTPHENGVDRPAQAATGATLAVYFAHSAYAVKVSAPSLKSQ